MKNYTKKTKVKFIAVTAGLVVVFTTIGGGVAYAYTTPYSYVSLDVNPSIEYSVNIFDKVIDANAVNEDGKTILKNIDVENEPIDQVIKDTVSEISDQGYIVNGETGGIVISTSSDNDNKADELAEELKADAEEAVIENNLEAEVETLSVGKERVEKAKELGVTPGKLNLVEKLQQSAKNPDDVSLEEWLNKPVKEIMKATKANREEQKVKADEGTPEEGGIVNNGQDEEGITKVANESNRVEDSDKKVNEKKSNKVTEKKEANITTVEKKDSSNVSIDKKNSGNPSIEKDENKSEDKKTENKGQNAKDNKDKEDKGNSKENKNK